MNCTQPLFGLSVYTHVPKEDQSSCYYEESVVGMDAGGKHDK